MNTCDIHQECVRKHAQALKSTGVSRTLALRINTVKTGSVVLVSYEGHNMYVEHMCCKKKAVAEFLERFGSTLTCKEEPSEVGSYIQSY